MQQTEELYQKLWAHKQDAALFERANQMAWEYAQADKEQRVFPEEEALELLKELDRPLPERG